MIAGVVAFVLVALFMIANYRLPGAVAVIALLGQTAMTLAFVSGYFSVLNSFTLTLPGIAGIILAIGMGVDANVIAAERIKEEIRSGKSIDGAARDIITEAGYGPYFGHSYGHSLGLEIHEAPNCTPRNENPIPAGAVCSAEPGIYIPGKFGVRIEDVVIFREGGCEVITHSPKELTIL